MALILQVNLGRGRLAQDHDQFAGLKDALRGCRESCDDVLLTGDLNSKATVWGSEHTDPRERTVLEMAARLDLTVLNSGVSATFKHVETRGSIVDLTLASPRLAARVSAWRVLEDYTASDHQYIVYKVENRHDADPREGTRSRVPIARLNREALHEALADALLPADSETTSPEGAEARADRNM